LPKSRPRWRIRKQCLVRSHFRFPRGKQRLGQLRTRTINRIKHLLRKHNLEQECPTARFILGQLVRHVLRCDRRMKSWYQRIKKRRGSKIGRVAVMRRLATIIWHMVKYEEPYMIGGPPSGSVGSAS
jgi:hypothetical protein